MDEVSQELLATVAKALGVSVESMKAQIEQRRAIRERRVAARNERFDVALRRVTPVQEVIFDQLLRQGYCANSNIWRSKKTGNVARTFSKQVWDSAKGRMGRVLVTVYPDGTMNRTMEKRISIRDNF